MMPTLWITAAAIILLSLAALFWMSARLKRQQMEIDRLGTRLETMSADMSALCAAAVGVDRRVGQLENQSRRIDLRQETLENHLQDDDRPYGEAIQMVQKGASASGLVEKLGLSQSEADLVAMLHGKRQAG